MIIPPLTTERLLLRAFEPRDVEPYITMMADPEVARYLADGRALSRAEAWRQLAMFLGHWTLNGFGVWAVEERATGRLLGRIGCMQPEGWPGFEVAYTLARFAWGRGYAREGAAAALQYAHETLGQQDVISIIRPQNAGSIRVATSLGASLDGTVEFFGAPALIYRYPRPGPRTTHAADEQVDHARMQTVVVGTADAELVALEAELRLAQLNADVATLDRLIADDLLFTGPDGQLGTKAEDLAAHGSGIVRFRAHEPEELRVRAVGEDVRVVALQTRLTVEVNGTPVSGTYRYTRVWAKALSGPWRIVAGHVSAVTADT